VLLNSLLPRFSWCLHYNIGFKSFLYQIITFLMFEFRTARLGHRFIYRFSSCLEFALSLITSSLCCDLDIFKVIITVFLRIFKLYYTIFKVIFTILAIFIIIVMYFSRLAIPIRDFYIVTRLRPYNTAAFLPNGINLHMLNSSVISGMANWIINLVVISWYIHIIKVNLSDLVIYNIPFVT